MLRFSLDGRPAAQHWGALIIATLVFVPILRLIGLPAALLLGSMAAAALLASFHGRVRIPAWSFILAQSVVGCLIARAIGSASTAEMARQWPIFVTGILTVMAFGAALGLLLARWKVLPGTTAVWGSSPGGATAMVLMAEAYGADIRLVAVMQYLRVAIVGLAGLARGADLGRFGSGPPRHGLVSRASPGPFLATLALIAGGAVDRREIEDSRRRDAGADVHRRRSCRRATWSRSPCRPGCWPSATPWSAGRSACASPAR